MDSSTFLDSEETLVQLETSRMGAAHGPRLLFTKHPEVRALGGKCKVRPLGQGASPPHTYPSKGRGSPSEPMELAAGHRGWAGKGQGRFVWELLLPRQLWPRGRAVKTQRYSLP